MPLLADLKVLYHLALKRDTFNVPFELEALHVHTEYCRCTEHPEIWDAVRSWGVVLHRFEYSISSRIRGAVRGVESAYRYGGEEFCVLLEDCDTAEAMRVADRLRAAVSEVPIPSREGRDLRVTCSMGVATVPGNARTVEGLLCAADRALLASKSLGKDRASLPPVDRHGCLV